MDLYDERLTSLLRASCVAVSYHFDQGGLTLTLQSWLVRSHCDGRHHVAPHADRTELSGWPNQPQRASGIINSDHVREMVIAVARLASFSK
jgi:hypothetical protein